MYEIFSCSFLVYCTASELMFYFSCQNVNEMVVGKLMELNFTGRFRNKILSGTKSKLFYVALMSSGTILGLKYPFEILPFHCPILKGFSLPLLV